MKKLLPRLMATLTRHPRYKPEIEWSANSWTHNTFRCYETIFGRRFGIRAEMSASVVLGKTTYACHSWEAVFVLTEQYLREALSSWKLATFKIYIPVLTTPQRIPLFASPYIFAIAFDTGVVATGNNGTGTSATTAFTVTGSNPMITACFEEFGNASLSITGVTYNAVSLTALGTPISFPTNNYIGAYFLPNCATGSNNAVFSKTSSSSFFYIGLASYSGVSNTATAEGANSATSTSSTSFSMSATSTSNNAWHIFFTGGTDSNVSAGTGTTSRVTTATNLGWIGDSNSAKTPAGSVTLQATAGSSTWGGWIAAFAPSVAAAINSNFLSFM